MGTMSVVCPLFRIYAGAIRAVAQIVFVVDADYTHIRNGRKVITLGL